MCFLQKNCNEKGWARKKYSIKRQRGFHKNEALARGSHSTMRIKILPRCIQIKGKFYPSSKKNHKKIYAVKQVHMYLLGSLYKRFRDFNYIMLFYNVKVLGQIHDNSDPLEYYQNTLDILKILINALTSSQRETIDANSCHEGFMRWNDYCFKIWWNTANQSCSYSLRIMG